MTRNELLFGSITRNQKLLSLSIFLLLQIKVTAINILSIEYICVSEKFIILFIHIHLYRIQYTKINESEYGVWNFGEYHERR